MLFIHYDYGRMHLNDNTLIDMSLDTETLIYDAYGEEIDLMSLDTRNIIINCKIHIYVEYLFIFLSIPFSKRIKSCDYVDMSYVNFTIKDYKNFLRELDYDKAFKYYEIFTFIYKNFSYIKYYPTIIYMYKLTEKYLNLKFKNLVNIVNMELKLRK